MNCVISVSFTGYKGVKLGRRDLGQRGPYVYRAVQTAGFYGICISTTAQHCLVHVKINRIPAS